MQDILYGLMWVALGSVFGGIARYFVSGLVGRRIGETFPWGTLTVNISGCLAIGLLVAAADNQVLLHIPTYWQIAVVGFLGCYTTVSSFSLQTLMLVRDGEFLYAGGNLLLSFVLCFSAVVLGFATGTAAIAFGAP